LFWHGHKPTGNKPTEIWQHVSVFLCKSARIKVFMFCGVCRSYLLVVAVLAQSTASFRYAGPNTVDICRLTDAEMLLDRSAGRRNAFIHPRPPTNAISSWPVSSFGRRTEGNRQISPRSQIHDLQRSLRNFQHSEQGYTRTHNPNVPGQENILPTGLTAVITYC
jgi:hypothetical protein